MHSAANQIYQTQRCPSSSAIIAPSMEFWGVEVKVRQPIQVVPGVDNIIHLSLACLAEAKKDAEKDLVHLYVNTENQNICIGTLSADKCPQIGFDLVFDKEFELSHTSKSASVHFCGYKTNISDSYSEDTGNVAPIGLVNKEVVEPSKQLNHGSDDSSDDEDEGTPNAEKVSSEEDDSDESGEEDDSDESDGDDETDDSDEDESDKVAENKTTPGNKRENASIQPTVPAKKAKLITPQKIEAKKSGSHVATPYPSKQVVKMSSEPEKPKQQSQKIVEFRCNPCNRTFGSENALQSHSKAKHGPK